MKQIFETLIISVSFVFVSWLIIAVGMKFEVKIKGEDYGFSVGGEQKTTSVTAEQRFRSAFKHTLVTNYYSTTLTTNDVRKIAEAEADKHPQYDSLYVNIIPFSECCKVYTVTGLTLAMLHFTARKERWNTSMVIEYDSLKQNIDHFWNYVQ